MAVESVRYAPTLGSDTYRGESPVIWKDFPVDSFIQDPRLGMYFFDDFAMTGYQGAAGASLTGSMGQWSIYEGSNCGAIVDAASAGGVLQFVPSSGTVSTGASNTQTSIFASTGAFQFQTSSANASNLQQKMAFECRIMLTSITSGQRDAFIGLTDTLVPSSNLPFTVVSAGSSQMLTTTRNLIGFYNADSGRGQDWAFVFQLASTAPVFCTGLQSLVSTITGTAIAAGTWYKLGFVYDPNAPQTVISSAGTGQTAGNTAKAMLKVYVNGMLGATFLTAAANIQTASFPTGVMGPCISFANVSNSGTSNSATNLAGLMNVDWIRVAQFNAS